MRQEVLAYSPKLYLIESHVACYKIYILKNPLDNQIFYVGQTINDLSERLYGHINQTGASNRDKINYIKSIIEKGEKPIIEQVETIHTTCYIDKASVNERENYWIKYYRGIGCKLFNIANPKNYEYQNYLSSIKKGESKWHYYYCGKTISGYEVYDETRLKADGFSLPTVYVPNPPINQSYKQSFHYKRMLNKLGRNALDDRWFYDESTYRDCNTDYYDDDY